MQNYLILLLVMLLYIAGGVAISIISALVVNYLSEEDIYEDS